MAASNRMLMTSNGRAISEFFSADQAFRDHADVGPSLPDTTSIGKLCFRMVKMVITARPLQPEMQELFFSYPAFPVSPRYDYQKDRKMISTTIPPAYRWLYGSQKVESQQEYIPPVATSTNSRKVAAEGSAGWSQSERKK